MDAKSEIESDRYTWLIEEILNAQGTGVSVSVDGKHYSLENVEEICGVKEESHYMKSYVSDRSGKIVQIDFDQIIGV